MGGTWLFLYFQEALLNLTSATTLLRVGGSLPTIPTQGSSSYVLPSLSCPVELQKAKVINSWDLSLSSFPPPHPHLGGDQS